jgi:hypothetical protein
MKSTVKTESGFSQAENEYLPTKSKERINMKFGNCFTPKVITRSEQRKKKGSSNYIYDSKILTKSPYYDLLKTNMDYKEEKVEEKSPLSMYRPKKIFITNEKKPEEVRNIYR